MKKAPWRTALYILALLQIAQAARAQTAPVTEATAIDCGLINSLWSQQFRSDFNVQWKLDTFSCPDSQEYLIARAIYDLYAPQLNDNGPNFYDYAKSRIASLQKADCDNGDSATDCQTAVDIDPSGNVTVYGGFYGAGEVWNASTFYHEARHVDGDDPGHATCDHGSSANEDGACDNSFDATLGANASGFNYDVSYYSRVLKSSSYDKLDREIMASTLNDLLANRFNNISAEDFQTWSIED